MGFYSSTAVTYKKIALPQFEKPINALRLEFWTRPEGYTHYLWGNFAVGYMTDLSDDNTFVAVQTYAYNDWNDISYTKKTVEFENAPDNAYIVMRHYNCNPSYYWLVDDVTVSEVPQFTVSDNGNTYTIWTAKGWGMVCDLIEDKDTYNGFLGKTICLGNDISVTRMMGSESRKFKGTFDGCGKTLTVNYSGSGDYIAPFPVVSDEATFRNLTINGTINATGGIVGGLIGCTYNNSIIEHCTSNVEITSTSGTTGGFVGLCKYGVSFTDCNSNAVIHCSDGNNGGFVGYSWSSTGCAIGFEGCVFNGKLLKGSDNTNNNGGFIGWTGAALTVTLNNCLYAPAALVGTEAYASDNSATFARGWNGTPTNCYYIQAFGTPQGTKAYSINKGENVIGVYNSTGYTYTYNTSRLQFYNTGFYHNYNLPTAKLYAAAGDEVHISINTPISCADFSTEPAGIPLTLSSNGAYRFFTMPSSNVTINAAWSSSVVVSDFPWTENFNDLTDDASIPGCWNYMEIEGTFHNRWGYFTTNGYGATNGTSYDGTNCVRYDSYNNFNGTTNYLKTVPLRLPASPEMQLSFWYKNPAGGDFSVYLSTDGGDTHTTALATGLTNQQEWTQHTISLGAYAGQEVVIVFKGTSNHNYNGDAYIYLDEVNVEDVLPCAKPTRLMATILGTQRVQLGWTKGDEDQTAWQICLDDDESNLIAAESNSYILDNLEIGSTHTAKVRANCGDGVSYWSNEVSFTMPLQEPVSYLDMNGDTLLCIDFTVLDGSQTFPLAAGWYVVEGTLNYNQTLTLSGDVHLILKDNAVMNIGTAETPVSGNGIGNNSNIANISIYGQSTGENNGQLNVYASQYGIWAYNGDFNCSSAKVTVSASNYGIWAGSSSNYSKGNINLKDATVTVNSTNGYAIYAQGGNLNIDGGKVTATGKNYVIYAYKQYYGGNITISGGQVTSNGGTCGLYVFGGGLNISGGQVTANGGNYGIYAYGGNITISGGQVTTNGGVNGIYAYHGNITLGWTDASDFIHANSYLADGGTIAIAEGKAFIDEDGIEHTSGTVNASDINGKTLYPYIQESVPYLDENGDTQQCTAYTVLTGTETTLAAGWYVADGTLDYDHTLTLSGDVHLILKDNAVMNVGTIESPISGHGINGNGHSISIYAQSMGSSKGQLHVNANACGIFTKGGNVNICGGEVEATADYSINVICNGGNGGILTISNATVTATGETMGIYAEGTTINSGTVTANGSYGLYDDVGNLNINGGQVTANGSTYGIYTYGGNITLGWTDATDYIHVNSYLATGTLSIAEGKTFKDENGMEHPSGPVNASEINGKWLYPSEANLFTKEINARHTTGEGVNQGWHLIASPLAGQTNAEAVAHLINTTNPENFDLYRFNEAADLEWENWKKPNEGEINHYHFGLEAGKGYLYANAEAVTLVFAGTPYSGNGEVTLTKTDGAELSGWNLVGNPFATTATLDQPYYRMNDEGSALNTSTEDTEVAAMEGVFVQADNDGQTLTFTAQTRGGEQAAIPQANIMVVGDNGAILDNAIIRFDGGQTLEKFSFREGSTKVYIPQDGTDYAIACAESTGEMPVNFKASENGTYTLTVSTTLNSQLSTLNSKL